MKILLVTIIILIQTLAQTPVVVSNPTTTYITFPVNQTVGL